MFLSKFGNFLHQKVEDCDILHDPGYTLFHF